MAATKPSGSAPDLALLQLCFDESEIATGRNDVHDSDQRTGGTTTFDAETFVLNKEQHVPLATLQSDLESYAKHLGDALMKSVHEEVHDAFVAVSAQLATHENALKKVHAPILELHGAVDSAKEGLDRSRATVLHNLRSALAADEVKTVHGNVLEVAVCHRRLRFLLHVLRSSTAKSDDKVARTDDDDDDDELDDLADEIAEPVRYRELATLVVRQRYLLRTAKSLADRAADPDAKQALATVDEAASADTNDVLALLQSRFLSAVSAMHVSPSKEAASRLGFIVSMYQRIGSEDKLVECFREHVVRPIVEDVVSWKVAAQARPNAEEVAQIISNLHKALLTKVCSLLPVLRPAVQSASSSTTTSTTQSHQLVAAGIWSAVCDTLMKRMMYLFAAGLPAIFHKFFVAANQLVRMLEEQCASFEELHELRSSPDMALWSRKWGLDVYHTLRQTELQDKLQAAFQQSGFQSPANPSGGAGPTTTSQQQLPAFEATQRHLLWWFDPREVFLFPLYPRSLKDAHGAIVALLDKAAEASLAGGVSVAIAAASSCNAFAEFTKSKLVEVISVAAMEPHSSGPAVSSSTTSSSLRFCEFIVSLCQAKSEAILKAVITSVSDQCLKHLDHIRTLRSTFTMTKKGIPTAPSVFVAESLNPVKEFRKAAQSSKSLTDVEIATFTQSILSDVCRRFGAVAKDTIVTAKKSADHLDKLKRRNNTSAAAAATTAADDGAKRSLDTISDVDKMVVQLYLDSHELGSLMRQFGIFKENFAPLQTVLSLVKRADWILGGFVGPEPPDPWAEADAASA